MPLNIALTPDQKRRYTELNGTCLEGVTSIQLRFEFGTNAYSWLAVDDVEVTPVDSATIPKGTIKFEYNDPNWKDKPTSYNGAAITYDAIGNPLNYNGYTYSWQNGR